MTVRRDCGDGVNEDGGFTGFLRSLLAGIPWSESAERKEELLFAAPARGVLRLHNANGNTRVCGEDRSDIALVMTKSARAESEAAAEQLLDEIQIVDEENGDALELEVEIPRRWNRRGSVSIELRLPRELQVELTAVNGRIEIEGLRNRVRARSSNGSACVADVMGDIEIVTSNAKVCCSGTCGRLVARSSNGKIEIASHRGSVDASTSNGLIKAALDSVDKQGVQLATSNGRITLELPDAIDADIDIRIDNGIIRNDRKLQRTDRETNGRLSGRLGNGGALIKLRGSNVPIS